jgi:hypothetical protein
MDLALILMVVFMIVFLVLAILMIMALRTPKVHYDPNQPDLPPHSKSAKSYWQNTVSKMLVMRPWPYKDLWNPLNRLYWPDEQTSNRVQRRHYRRKRSRR